MTNTQQKYADTRYAATVGLLVLGLIFSPVVLAVSRPLGGAAVSLAAVFSAICVVLAWFAWAKDSRRSRLSVVTQPTR